LNEKGFLHYSVLLSTDNGTPPTPPTALELRGGAVAGAKAEATNVVAAAGVATSIQINGLDKSTGYTVYVTGEDEGGNMASTAVVEKSFTTSGDATPPVLTGVTMGAFTQGGGTLTLTSSEAGTAHYAVLLATATVVPSAGDIKAGGVAGAKASSGGGGGITVEAAVEVTSLVSGLSPETDYKVKTQERGEGKGDEGWGTGGGERRLGDGIC
jgi:hypothetical protein